MTPVEHHLANLAQAVENLEIALVDTHGERIIDNPTDALLAAHTLLYAADALSYAIRRYRAEHAEEDVRNQPQEQLPF